MRLDPNESRCLPAMYARRARQQRIVVGERERNLHVETLFFIKEGVKKYFGHADKYQNKFSYYWSS
jgi:hypothetical protein